jgi:C4-dicarboxylate transporter DctQ subunit
MKLFGKILDWFEEIIMGVGLFVMVAFNFLNVICRFFLPQTPFSFTEELTLLLFMWVTMLGISCGYKRGAHTGLSLLTDVLPTAMKKICIVLATFGSLVLMGVLFWSGSVMVQNQLKFGNIMPGLKISAAFGGLSIPIGSAIVFFRVIQTGIQKVLELDKQEGQR